MVKGSIWLGMKTSVKGVASENNLTKSNRNLRERDVRLSQMRGYLAVVKLFKAFSLKQETERKG